MGTFPRSAGVGASISKPQQKWKTKTETLFRRGQLTTSLNYVNQNLIIPKSLNDDSRKIFSVRIVSSRVEQWSMGFRTNSKISRLCFCWATNELWLRKNEINFSHCLMLKPRAKKWDFLFSHQVEKSSAGEIKESDFGTRLEPRCRWRSSFLGLIGIGNSTQSFITTNSAPFFSTKTF